MSKVIPLHPEVKVEGTVTGRLALPPRIEVGYNLRTKTLGTIVGTPSRDVIPFSAMSKDQRHTVIAALVPLAPATLEYAQTSTTNRVQDFWWEYKKAVAGDFNPILLKQLRDDVEWERKWRVN